MSKEIKFAKQKHRVFVSSRLIGDIEYKQNLNYTSNNQMQRERAYLLFDRVSQGIYNIANDIEPTEITSTGRNNEYVYQFSDGFGRMIFQLLNINNTKLIKIIDILWDYKKQEDSWWSIVENHNFSSMTYHQKRLLYESIMKEVAVIVKRALNDITKKREQ